jgi:O-antigen ligase
VTFAAGGVYPWVWVPAACAVALLTVVVGPRSTGGALARSADVALSISALAIVLQLIPLPVSILRAADPHALSVRASLWLSAPDSSAGHLPISIVPRDTFAALGIFAGALLLFWTCRQICEKGGTGRMVRAIAVIGLIGSIAAIVQRAQNQELLYGIWRPLDAGARPYGPFVNRNHFATWVLMACPLVFGYLLARTPERRPSPLMSQRVANALKHLGSMRIWLVASVCIMTLAVLISASRSGLIGLMCAITASLLLRRKQTGGASVQRWTIFQGALLVVAALWFANFDALLNRVDETLQSWQTGRGRSAIWADAQRLIRDFPMTGTGAGTFGTSITVYQTAEPGYSIGNAHNHYLQLAAEGGLLVGAPAAITIGVFLALCARRLREDNGRDYLVRAGAVAGIAAVLLQSFWETGLRMPANAMLLAVLAAIATYDPTGPGVTEDGDRC